MIPGLPNQIRRFAMGPDHPPDRLLTSWKAIAEFFGRDVRTVQRWERNEGLPVRRHLHQRQNSVYADPEDLRRWWSARGAVVDDSVTPVDSVTPGHLPTRRRTNGRAAFVAASAAVLTLAVAGAVWRGGALGGEEDGRVIWLERDAGAASAVYPSATGDFNGDGIADLALNSLIGSETYVLFGGRLPASGQRLAAAAGATLVGSPRNQWSVSQAGDFNGDKIDDLLISGLMSEPENLTATGPALIVFGRRHWPARMALPDAADVTLRLDWPTDARMGGCNASRPDLNRDGLADILLVAPEFGARDRRSAGANFALFGRRSWPRELEVASAADIVIHGARAGEGLGSCAPGDFDADGLADVAVFGKESTLWNLLGGRGRAYVFLAQARGKRSLDAATEFALRVDGSRPSADTFLVLADVNGDGADDLVIAHPRFPDTPSHAGEIQIWFGAAHRLGVHAEGTADVTVTGTAAGGRFAIALTAADFDRDGADDLVVAEPGSGDIHLISGRRQWKTSGRVDEYGVRLFDGRPGQLASRISVADLDGDGLPEVAFAESGSNERDRAGILRPYAQARLDVRPGHEDNVVIVPDWPCVALLYWTPSSKDDEIDPATVRLGGASLTRHVWVDANGDGVAELQGYFDTSQMAIAPDTRKISLVARTRGGRLVGATDAIVVQTVATSATKPLSSGRF
jgi:VCBS repeat protein